MGTNILRLHPGPVTEVPLEGTYLAHRVRELGSPAAPFVYANFVCSLDGRIALHDPKGGASYVPADLTSSNDFRLFLELQAQADCLITHGGYLRDIAEGRLDDILQVGLTDATRDLARWRQDNGLAPQPAVVIASASLDFPIPASLGYHGQRVLIATGAAAPPDRLQAVRERGYEIVLAGKGRQVEGAPLVRALAGRGLRCLYMLTGPRMLETMLRDGVLSRLYITIAHHVLGGMNFDTLIAGPELGVAGRLRMASLYYDMTAPGGAGQWFAQFEPLRALSRTHPGSDRE